MKNDELVFGVSDFVAIFNQTLETAYPSVTIVGEIANFKVSKNRWVYFDLKDELSSVKFFGTVYMLPGPLEDGLLVKVRGAPRLHPQFGFSVNIMNIQPVGEGSIKRAAGLLEAKLRAEGLFADSRKRPLPYPPSKIGLITSAESAAYHDFIKVLNSRWGGVEIQLADVQVQGEASPAQIIKAIEYFNQTPASPEALIITRGGGSAEDLAAFSTESVTRAVAASRIPTLVAVGHEVDISLTELAADRRASTPSNAAELLVPDKHHETLQLNSRRIALGQKLESLVVDAHVALKQQFNLLYTATTQQIQREIRHVLGRYELLSALNPANILKRGYAVVRNAASQKVIKSVKSVTPPANITIQWVDGQAHANVTSTSTS